MATLAFALALAQATGSLTCRDEQVVSYSPEQIAAATAQAHRADPTGCENATVEGGHAVFSALENSTANAHHKLTTLPLPGIAAIGADTLWAATIHVSGDFSQASCDPDLTGECDLVAGLSDATTVWAVSRGATFLDTLVPFPDTANRPRTGHFFDAYARPAERADEFTGVPAAGWMVQGFVGVINATRAGVVLSNLTSDGVPLAADHTAHWNGYTIPEHTPLAGTLSLVLFRDEPQQIYKISGITVTIQICTAPADIFQTELEECNEEEGYGEAAELIGGAAMGIGIYVIAQCLWRRYGTPAVGQHGFGLGEPLSPADLAYDPNDDDVPLSLMTA